MSKCSFQKFGLAALGAASLFSGNLWAQQNQILPQPASQAITAVAGGAPQSFSIITTTSQSATPLNFTAGPETFTGGNWLSIDKTTGTTGITVVTATVNPAGLATGTYNGRVNFNPSTCPTPGGCTGNTTQIVLTIGGSGTNSQIIANPTLVNFPAGVNFLTVALTSVTGTQLGFNAVSSANWLTVNPSVGTTPATLQLTVNTSLLPAGNPTAQVTVVPTGGGVAQIITVTASSQGSSGVLSASPSSVQFSYLGNGSTIYPPNQIVNIINSSGAALTYSGVINNISGGAWLNIQQLTGTIPASGTAQLNLGFYTSVLVGLPAGTYTANVVISSGTNVVTIPVTLTVAGGGTSGSLTTSPTSVTFTGNVGSADPASQFLFVSALSGAAQTFTVSSSATWLTVDQFSATTPATINPRVFAAGVGNVPGTYSGFLTITPLNGFSTTVPVTYTLLGSSTTTVSPTSLTFTQPVGGAAPAVQTLSISSLSGNLNYVASATTSSGGNWLQVAPVSGLTPATLSVTVNASSLAVGTYNGSINVVVSGTSTTVTVPVTLTVTSSSNLTLTPAALNFTAQTGQPAPAAQTVAVGSSGTALNYTAQVTSASGNNAWLTVTPGSGATPSNLSVSVNPAGLTPAVYNGVITVTGTGSANGPQTIAVTLTVSAPTAPTIISMVNAASLSPTAISPGLILTVRGANMGPTTGVPASVGAGGILETTLSEVRVLFDNIPAALLFVRNDQINAVAPYEVFGRLSTRVQVEYKGIKSDPLEIRVVDSTPAIFTTDGTGRGQAAALNQNGTVNGFNNPADSNSVIVLYATGEGQTSPSGVNGRVIGTDLRRPMLPVSVFINGQPAVIEYAGSAPGLVSGAIQINARIPPTANPSGVPSALGVEIQVNRVPTPGPVTVFVR